MTLYILLIDTVNPIWIELRRDYHRWVFSLGQASDLSMTLHAMSISFKLDLIKIRPVSVFICWSDNTLTKSGMKV